jgi:hypothetical protein
VCRRAFSRLKSEAVASCFMAWVRAIKRHGSRYYYPYDRPGGSPRRKAGSWVANPRHE